MEQHLDAPLWMDGWMDEGCRICKYGHDETTSVCTIFDGWMDGQMFHVYIWLGWNNI
jgi:hypothetical protein